MGIELQNENGVSGYFAAPPGGGPGVIVIQEWWGLVPHIRDVVDRYAEAGFVALAPDLYHGETTTEPDEAGKYMMALNTARATEDLSAALTYLQDAPDVTSSTFGVVGFCMGGGLALVLAAAEPTRIGACAPYYGLIPWKNAQPDYSNIQCEIRGHYAELDGFFGPDAVASLQSELDNANVTATLRIHSGCDHAFFNNDRPEVYNDTHANEAFADTTAFFCQALGSREQ